MFVQNTWKLYIEISILFRQQTYTGYYQKKLIVDVTFCWLCSWIIELTPNYMSLRKHSTDIFLSINQSINAFLLFTFDCLRAHLHLARATPLPQPCEITPRSIPCILCCTVTPGRSVSVNTLQWIYNPFWSDSIVVNKSCVASVIPALTLHWRWR